MRGNTRPSTSWLKPGVPSGDVADVLQTLEVLAELDQGRDPRLTNALTRVESGQNSQGQPSTWVTLRACTVLRAAYG